MFTKRYKSIKTIVIILVFGIVLSSALPVSASAIPQAVQALPTGTLDTTFGTNGVLATDFGGYDFANSMILQPDGKIIVVGSADERGSHNFALARYNTDGSLDTTFSRDGKQDTDFGGSDNASGLALQADGKIVVAGYRSIEINRDIVVARYNRNGSLDTTFSGNGKVIAYGGEVNAWATDVAIQADGKIVVVGGTATESRSEFVVIRYNRNGSLDRTFDTDGKVITEFDSGNASASAVTIQPDGKIVVTGYSHNGAGYSDYGNDGDFAAARYNNDGSLDTTFGEDGRVTTDFGGYEIGSAAVLQPDGRMIVVGGSGDQAGCLICDIALARYNRDGSLDTTFDTDGKITTNINLSDFGSAIDIQPDGKIVVAGRTGRSIYVGSIQSDFALVRYNRDGSLDTTFGTEGKISLDLGSVDDIATDLAIQPDGKIVLFGDTLNDDTDFALARYSGYEISALTVTKTDDTDDGVCDSDCSLREAIAASLDVGLIDFSISGTITLVSPLPVIDKPLFIDGSGQSIIVDGARQYRIFEVTTTGDLTINNLTIQYGAYTSPCFSEAPGSPSCGGGIYSNGILTVTNSTFSHNIAQNGGGIFIDQGTANIINSTFINNAATNVGGGIINWLGTVTVANSTFVGNLATQGGGIYNDVSSLTLVNSTFSQNSASHGAGIYNAGILDFANNILANSSSGSDCYNEFDAGEIEVGVNNLIEHNADSPNHCGTPALSEDPGLGPLADNGGFTQTMALLTDSPAIDAGNDSVCPASDQRGITRPQGLHCDIGAFEFNVFQAFLAVPANEEPLLHRRPSFDWSDVPGATSYQIVASTSSTLNPLLWKVNNTDSTYTPTTDLPGGKVIYWQVRAKVGGVWMPWSETWSFTTAKPPSIPVLVAPVNKALTKNYIRPLRWKASTVPSGAAAFDHYQVQVSLDKAFSDPLWIDEVTSDAFYTPTTDLAANTRYFWRVRAFNVAGQYSSWSTVWSFFTALLPPGNLTPMGGETVSSRKPLLDWEPVDGASGYTVQISTNSSFSTLLVDTSVNTDAFTPGTKLPANRTLYWRVRATGTNGPSRWTTAAFHTP